MAKKLNTCDLRVSRRTRTILCPNSRESLCAGVRLVSGREKSSHWPSVSSRSLGTKRPDTPQQQRHAPWFHPPPTGRYGRPATRQLNKGCRHSFGVPTDCRLCRSARDASRAAYGFGNTNTYTASFHSQALNQSAPPTACFCLCCFCIINLFVIWIVQHDHSIWCRCCSFIGCYADADSRQLCSDSDRGRQ